ncbi:XRE family transcriptional regulator [Zoogloea oleivorans]|jgi:transcriptional regulator with XRE-family HTH domain|uniref:XRE family transcriptional regulator n=1 Tax=Zoogloea oleivorans TaxID=1552750 RepID=A0A6C2CGG1_9RHOO|nr:XRE family transcriptional regulator [Zoogloea oleivorans]
MPTPLLLCITGRQAYDLRRHLFLTQAEFWSKIGITQSGGSRYERGREMAPQLQYLLHLAYGSDEEASELLRWLRQPAESR